MNYKKEFLTRGLLGIPMGIASGLGMLIIMSYIFKESTELALSLDSLLKNYIATAILGFCFASTTVFLQVEKWSLLKQTIIHLLPNGMVILLIGFWAEWYSLNTNQLWLFIGIFVLMYFCAYFTMWFVYRKRAEDINTIVESN